MDDLLRAPGTERLLAPDTTMGPVTLHVAHLDAMTRYYRDVLTLQVVEAEGASVTLGRAGRALVVLRHGPHLAAASPDQAGLFHTAILFESAQALAGSLASVARHGSATYTGSADHLVSLAFYLTDPEGNGVELYVDRPREQWKWRGTQVQMASLALDPTAFIDRYLTPEVEESPQDAGAVVGHVHLQVGDIPTARAFYVDALGFATTFEMPSALFVSAGGYHHHLAVNTWRSAGAARRAITLGLGEVTIDVPAADDLGRLQERLAAARVTVRDDGASVTFEDPWANLVRVRVLERAA
jgi:catechol 2,3-dioxygenase